MAQIDDCLKKLRDAGATIDAQDERQIREFIDQGMEPLAAVRHLYIQRSKNVIDILGRARGQGAPIAAYRDTYDEVISRRSTMLARAMQSYMDERNALGIELANLHQELRLLDERGNYLETFASTVGVESSGNPALIRGQPGQMFYLGFATDEDLLRVFDIMEFQDRQRIKAGKQTISEVLGIEGDTPETRLKSWKEQVAERLTILERDREIRDQLRSMERRIDTMMDRETRNPDFGALDSDGNYRIDPGDPDGVAEDILNYSVTYSNALPWTVTSSKTGEGDLYIRRHGKNAGKPFRERQSENDLAISFNQDVLLPDYMFYVLQYLQPKVAERLRGTAQQYITKGDIDELILEFFQSQVREPEVRQPPGPVQGDLFSDPNQTPQRKQAEAKANYEALVGVVEEGTFAVGLSQVNNAEQAAHVLAQIRKNAQEGFWGLVLGENNEILGIVNHSKGGIDGTSVYPAIFAGHVLQIPGAKKLWLGHNHPSGTVDPSGADQRISKTLEDLMRGSDVEIQGHVVVASGRDTFGQMDDKGTPIGTGNIEPRARDRQVPVYTRKITGQSQIGVEIRTPSDVESFVDKVQLKEGVVFLDNRHRVVGVMEMTAEEQKRLRGTGQLDRMLRAQAELNAAAYISVTQKEDPDASSNMAGFAEVGVLRQIDSIYRDTYGVWKSMASRGTLAGGKTFNQDLVGITSGLLEAAKNMPQAKGPAEQMIAVLKKQPGVKKEEYDWLELEDWIRNKGYVTRDEIIDFVDKNGIVVEEFWFTEDANVGRRLTDVVLQRKDINPLQFDMFDWMDELGSDHLGWLRNLEGFEQEAELAMQYEALEITAPDDEGRRFGILLKGDPADGPQDVWIFDLEADMMIVNNVPEITDIVEAENHIKELLLEAEQGARRGLDVRGNPRYVQHSLDGGVNHRELVFRLPPDKPPLQITGQIIAPPDAVDTLDAILVDIANHEAIGGGLETEQLMELDYGRVTDQIIEIHNFTEQQWDAIGGIVDLYLNDGVQLTELGRKGDEDQPLYTQSHAYNNWDNILMWVRMNERVGPNGERILFIEEIQSDWHQTGRQYGYHQYGSQYRDMQERIANLKQHADEGRAIIEGPLKKITERFFAQPGATEAVGSALQPGRAQSMEALIRTRSDWLQQVERIAGDEWVRNNLRSDQIRDINTWRVRALNVASAERDLVRQMSSSLSPPDAPFKGNAWAELAMKRLIRLAAEEGFDQVAWTPGDVQNDRWDLSQVTDYVQWNPITNELEAANTTETVERHELDQWVGRGIADELRRQADERWVDFDIEEAALADVTNKDVRWAIDTGVYARLDPDELANGFVAIDMNGELMRDWSGDILFAENEQDIKAMAEAELATMEDQPTVTGEGLRVGGQGMRSFYDKVLVNVASRAAKKFDKKVRAKAFGQEISTADIDAMNGAQNRLAKAQRELDEAVRSRANEAEIERLEVAHRIAFQAYSILEERTQRVHVLDISPEIQLGAMRGQTLFQSRRRGSITFDDQNKAIIRMTRARDMSTFLHESGHLYLELLGDLASMPAAEDQTKADYNKVLKFLGVEHRSQITREHHEKFARAFEAYLREGKAPDPGLRDVFHAFASWLRRIYVQLRQLDVELNDDIRGVFDRMIATDTAIKQAEQVQNFVELFTSAEDMGISEEAFEVYRRNAAEAHDEASMREQRKMLAAQLQEEQHWWQDERKKVEAEVRAEAEAMPVYRALFMFQYGTNPDGTTPEGATFKLSKDSVMRILSHSQDTVNRLPRPWIFTRKGGVDADVAARELGYRDGLQMLTEIMRSIPMEKFVRQETDARMAERFPDPLVSGELQEAALEAVHSDKRAQVMAAEMRAIRKKMKEDRAILEAERKAERRERLSERAKLPKRGELALIKEAAKRMIAQMRVRDVKPHVYLAAERKAGRLAFEALERKDFAAAYKHKRQQIVNHEMYRAANAAKVAAEKHRKYLARFDSKRLRERMGKGGVLDRIDAVLEHFNFRKISLAQVDREKAQEEMLKAFEDGTLVAPVTLLQKLTDRGQNYQDLTNEELQGLRDIVAQLEKIGRAHFEAVVMGEKKNIQDAAGRLADELRARKKPTGLEVGTETLGAATKRNVKSGLWNILRPAALTRILDDSEYGSFTQTLIEPIRRAYTEKMLPWFARMEEEIAGIYRKHFDDAELRALNNERIEIKTMGQTLTKADILSVALNWGNESNRAALLNGRHPVTGEQVYSQQAVKEILSHLSEKDWAFVQDMWDYIGSYYHDLKDDKGNVLREGIASIEKRRRGVAPQQVEAMPFEIRTVDGKQISLRGGYYPLSYDRRFSKKQRVQEFQDIENKMARGAFVRAQTRAGSTYERVQNHGKVVRLGLGLIDRHLREVIRDVAIGDEVNFVKRVLDDVNLDNALQETGNNDTLIQLNRWLADAAVGEIPAQGLPDQVFAYVRTGFTKAKLGWNLTTMFLQLTGFAQTAATIGTWTMMKGLGQYGKSPIDNWKFIMDASAFMKQRYVNQSWNKDVMDTKAHLDAFPLMGIGPTRSRRVTQKFARTLFAPIMAMQSQVDAVTWMAVYQEQMNEHQDHQKAVLRADAAVEKAQTSGFFSDRSALERGTVSDKTVQAQFVRIWTTLISYMMAKFGIAIEKTVTAKRQRERGEFGFGQAIKFASDMLMLFTIEGMMAALVYGNIPDWDEDEDESFLGWTFQVSAESLLSGIPFARETLAMRYGGGNTPIGGLARDAVNFYVQASQGEIDKALLKSLNNVGGTLFHYPSTQTNRMIDTAWSEFVEGEDRPAYEYLTGERGDR